MHSVFPERFTHQFFLLFVVFALTIIGCGSSGTEGPQECPGSPGCPDTETVTDTDTETDTRTAITPGRYNIIEERFPPCHAGGYLRYEIMVNQDPGSTQASIGMGDQMLVCAPDNESKILNCTGQFIFDEQWQPEYSLYSLTQLPDSGLRGETEYRVADTNDDCAPTYPTTYLPEYGSFLIRNRSSYALEYLSLLSCGSERIGRNRLSDEKRISAQGSLYFYNVTPACYDVVICIDREPTSYEQNCVRFNEFVLGRGRTINLTVNGEESNELRLQVDWSESAADGDGQSPWLREMIDFSENNRPEQ